MTDRITAGATALESIAADVSWDDVTARLADENDNDNDNEDRSAMSASPRRISSPTHGGGDDRQSSRTAMRLIVLTTAAALLVVVILAIRVDDEVAGVATQPTTVGTIAQPEPTPIETTAPSTTSTTYSKAELYEQARKDLLRTKLHEDLIAHLGDRYGGATYDGNDLVVLVKGLTPLDQEWLNTQTPNGVIRLEPTDISRSDLVQAQDVVNAELRAWPIESYSTGQLIDPPALSVHVQGHHEGLEARLRSLVAVPLVYAEQDEAIGDFLDGPLPSNPG